MLDPRHLMRATRWVQNPPSAKRVKFMIGVLVAALVIAGIEYLGLWPAWATADRLPRGI